MKNWQETGDGLVREFKFDDFKSALEFVNKIGLLAEAANHHPDITFGWGYARIALMTHSENSITNKDRDLAAQIDAL